MAQQKIKTIKKPWGKEVWFAGTKKYVGKLLYIKKGHRLSLQYHRKKDETIFVLQGSVLLTTNGRTKKMRIGSAIHLPPRTIHRMTAKYGDAILVEVSTPEVSDVVRLEDDYKRT